MVRARSAAGRDIWGTLHSLKTAGTISAGGLSGPYEKLVVLKNGRSVTSYALGPATVAKGFDGSVAWQRSPMGEVSVQDSEAGLRAAATEASLEARGPGEKSVSVGLARIDELVIGNNVALDGQLFRVLPMPGFEQTPLSYPERVAR